MLDEKIRKWQADPMNDKLMVDLAFALTAPLFEALLARLDGVSQWLMATFNLLLLYAQMVDGRMEVGPNYRRDEVREELKKTLDQALTLSKDLGLSNVSSAVSASGPGGIRTHDPRNAESRILPIK
jgi:hypothetical protein